MFSSPIIYPALITPKQIGQLNPIAMSNNFLAPGYTASANINNTQAYEAISGTGWNASSTSPVIYQLTFKFPLPVVVYTSAVTAIATNLILPFTYSFQSSNDGIDWITLIPNLHTSQTVGHLAQYSTYLLSISASSNSSIEDLQWGFMVMEI